MKVCSVGPLWGSGVGCCEVLSVARKGIFVRTFLFNSQICEWLWEIDYEKFPEIMKLRVTKKIKKMEIDRRKTLSKGNMTLFAIHVRQFNFPSLGFPRLALRINVTKKNVWYKATRRIPNSLWSGFFFSFFLKLWRGGFCQRSLRWLDRCEYIGVWV